jgi:DNA-binding MarR family transcriptional regulator
MTTQPASTTLSHRRRLAPLLRRTWYSLNQTFRRRIAHSGLTPDQFTALRWINEGDAKGRTANELCELMTSDPNTIAALLTRMQQLGLVRRAPHESDGRAWRIRLTVKGRRTFAAMQHIALDLQGEVLAVLPAGEREEFLDQLELLSNACRAALEASVKDGDHAG